MMRPLFEGVGTRRRFLRTTFTFAALSVVVTAGAQSLPSAAYAAAPIDLGSAASFGVLGGSTVANTLTAADTLVRGDLGASAAPAGFPPGEVTGEIYITGDGEYAAALADLNAAYSAAAAAPVDGQLIGDPSGVTIAPGVYDTVGAVSMAALGVLTLDGGEDVGLSDGVFIFQINGAFAMGANAEIRLIRGAQASNVFWQIDDTAGFGAGAEAVGTFMAQAAVSVTDGAVINGRVMSRSGAITLYNNIIYAAAPSVTITSPDTLTEVQVVTISGTSTADAGTSVSVTFDDAVVVPSPTVGVDGSWSVDAGLHPDGVYDITASVTDVVGNVGTDSQSLEIDTLDPVVTIDGGATATTNDPSPTISGSSDTGVSSIVELVIDGVAYTAMVQTGGTWNLTVALTAGDHTVTATGTDAAGNETLVAQTLTVDTSDPTLTIDPGATRLTGDSTPAITGTSDTGTGSTVTVTVAGQTLTTTVTAGGTWAEQIVTPLADGVYPVVASATDTSGNTGTAGQTLSVDTTAPSITINGGNARSTNDSTPTISGTTTAADASTVTVIVGGQPLSAVVTGGNWNATPVTLADITHTVVASVPDPAGNVGSATQALTIDTATPTVTINGSATATTTDSSPTITGTTSAPPAAIVTVTVADQTLTTLVQGNGTWNVSTVALTDGTYTVVVSVTDPAGNTATATQSLTVGQTPGPPPVLPPDQPPVEPPHTSTGRMRLTPITPVRLADTRSGAGGRVTAGGVLRVGVAGTPNVPADVTAAALNITAVGADAAGFLTVYPCSTTPPTTSTVNFRSGHDTANSTIATLAADGDVCVFSSTGAHVIVDITAWFSPNAANAMTATTPRRLADTRASSRVTAGAVLTVDTGDSQAAAVALNITAVGADKAGFLTAFPCDTTPPDTSTVNFGAHEARPNNAIVAVGAGGRVCVYTSATVDVIVDLTGVFSEGGSLEYLPSAPQRLLDTRATGVVPAGGQVSYDVGMTNASAVSINVTATGHTEDGFATTFGCGDAVPEASTLNQRAGEDNANGAITPTGDAASGCVFTSSATNIIIDLNGWWVLAV